MARMDGGMSVLPLLPLDLPVSASTAAFRLHFMMLTSNHSDTLFLYLSRTETFSINSNTCLVVDHQHGQPIIGGLLLG